MSAITTSLRSSERARTRGTLWLFAVSGAVGLGYQVLWSKYLLDFIGVSAYSYATVLAAFMGGLALGSALLGPLADRVDRPLFLFAGLELVIGLYGFAYEQLQSLAAELYREWVTGGASLTAGAWPRAAVAGALLVPPTMLMGGTYPAVLRQLTRELAASGRRASQVYAVNALGAAAGSLVTGFVLIRALGMSASLELLAASNLVVAAAAAGLALGWAPVPRGAAPADPSPELGDAGRPERWALPAILAAGFLGFALEIAWTRYLSLVLGSSTDSFAVMLSAFIAGIGIGSALLARWQHRIRDPLAAWGTLQLTLGLAILLPLPLLPYLPWVLSHVLALFAPTPVGYAVYTSVKLVASLSVMLPATLLLGMTLPLAIRGLTRSLGHLGGVAGRCYAWNTTGNVAGALCAGHWLMPQAGLEGLFRILGLASVLLGFGIVFARSGRTGSRRLAVAAVATLLAAGYHFSAGPWALSWFGLGAFRRSRPALSLSQTRAAVGESEVLLYREDPAASLMVTASMSPEGVQRSLSVNGKVEASNYGDMPTQVLVGHLPLLMHAGPRSVLVVGLASGATVGSVLRHPVERVDVAELIRSMPEATRLFDGWNGTPLDDPRTRLLFADARELLSRPGDAYDVIISEPSNPWMAGVASLFTVDFYARAVERLGPGGVFCQWVQLYELDDASFATALASFRSVFPYVYAFQALRSDLLLIGSREPIRPDWAALRERAGDPAVARDLAAVSVRGLGSLLALQRLSPWSVDLIVDRAPARNTDDNRLLEYRAPYNLFTGGNVSVVDRLDERRSMAPTLFLSELAGSCPECVDLGDAIEATGAPERAIGWLWDAWSTALVHLDPAAADGATASSVLPPEMLVAPPPEPEELRDRIDELLATGRSPLAEALLRAYRAALLAESAVSPEHAALWLEAFGRWQALSPRFRELWVELLLATRSVERAADELDAWFREPVPPSRDWYALVGCATGRPDHCERARRALASGSAAPTQAEAYSGLRRGRPNSQATPTPSR